jgi:hypothetical protein
MTVLQRSQEEGIELGKKADFFERERPLYSSNKNTRNMKKNITDLMAYHLSQIYQEVSKTIPVESSLSEKIQNCIHSTETFNSINFEPASTSQLESDLADTFSNLNSTLHALLRQELHEFASRQLSRVSFVSSSNGIKN